MIQFSHSFHVHFAETTLSIITYIPFCPHHGSTLLHWRGKIGKDHPENTTSENLGQRRVGGIWSSLSKQPCRTPWSFVFFVIRDLALMAIDRHVSTRRNSARDRMNRIPTDPLIAILSKKSKHPQPLFIAEPWISPQMNPHRILNNLIWKERKWHVSRSLSDVLKWLMLLKKCKDCGRKVHFLCSASVGRSRSRECCHKTIAVIA